MKYKSITLGAILYDPNDSLNEVQSIIRSHNKTVFRDICQALRIAITGSTMSPPIFEVMEILGKDECMERLGRARAL